LIISIKLTIFLKFVLNLMKYILSLFLLAALVNFSEAQDDDLILGKSSSMGSAAFYDLSDPTGVNMDVNVWGYVRLPGRYRVPVKTTFIDVMSFAGGPTDESNIEEIRILRNSNDPSKKPELIKLNYNDLLWGDNISSRPKLNPVLQSGDVILVLKERRYSVRDDVGFYLPIITTVVSFAILIITLTKN
jgi:hypothetical protein